MAGTPGTRSHRRAARKCAKGTMWKEGDQGEDRTNDGWTVDPRLRLQRASCRGGQRSQQAVALRSQSDPSILRHSLFGRVLSRAFLLFLN